MLEEFEKSVKATLYDRLTSPLVGSLVTAWSICNYKFFLIILSNLSFADKSVALENYFSRSNDFIRLLNWILSWFNRGEIISPTFCYYLNTYAIPICWTVIYIFVYPWAAEKVFKKWQNYIEKKREIKNDIEKKRRITVEEAEELYKACLKKENEITELMQNSKKELKEWKDRYNLLLEEKQQLQKQLSLHTKSAITDKAETNDTQNADLQNNSLWQAEMLELPSKAIELLKKVVSAKSERFHRIDFDHHTFLHFDNHEKILLADNDGEFLYKLIDYGLLAPLPHDYYKITNKGHRFINYLERQNDSNS